MSLEKIGITLYDLFGYLLPGFVLLLAFSLAEATFFGSSLIALSHMSDSLLISALGAYFLGHVAHSVASQLKEVKYDWFTDHKYRLDPLLLQRVRDTAKDAFGLVLAPEAKLGTFETYQLADAYVLASGGSAERDVMMAREGFFKASMVAFAILDLVLIFCTFAGGVKIQPRPNQIFQITSVGTGVSAILLAGVTWLFWKEFLYYNRIKINDIYCLFLAFRAKDLLKREEKHNG